MSDVPDENRIVTSRPDGAVYRTHRFPTLKNRTSWGRWGSMAVRKVTDVDSTGATETPEEP